ncbi:hypothetical protein [Kitasatospora sp. NBC_00315]|uniref:hypothetical protein n=1 Tax=Kitasatospora sp. NBC_00315 TaxID=2975963 RepID=UPI00324D0428
MNHDAVLRARVFLLGSGELDRTKALQAYRLLVPVNPAVYLPLLSRALLERAKGLARPEALVLIEEALGLAERLDLTDPVRADLVAEALGARARFDVR